MNANPILAARRLAACALCAAALAGCATKGDLRDLRAEIRNMGDRQEAAIIALQTQQRLTQDSIRGTTDELFNIRGSVANQLSRIVDQLEQLTEMTGQNQRAIASLRDQIQALRRSPASTMALPGDSATGVPAGAQTGVQRTATADEMYNAALTQFNRGSLISARIGFERFLQAYPNDELAPLAQYNLADILVQDGRLEEAIQSFQRVGEQWPGSGKVPDAIYRIGLLHVELGNEGEARRDFERVINSYPESGIADLARAELRKLGG